MKYHNDSLEKLSLGSQQLLSSFFFTLPSSAMQAMCSWGLTGDEPVDVYMLSVKYSCFPPHHIYIFIVFPCTSFLKISYCVNVLSGACTHHRLLFSIHFHKAIANSASVILIGLILFLFLSPSLCHFAAGVLTAVTVCETSHEGKRCYHMLSGLVLPHACLLLQDSERKTLTKRWAWRKAKKKKKEKNTCTAGRAERREYSGKTLAAGGGTHWETPNLSQNRV